MKKAVLLILGAFAYCLFLSKVSFYLIPDKNTYDLNVPAKAWIVPWVNYDGRNYLKIVTDGYGAQDKLKAFFPLYPLIIKTMPFNPAIVGLCVSLIFAIGSSSLFYKLAGGKALTLLLLFPTSFFLFAYYTESLFLFLVLLAFFLLEKKRYYLASILVVLATLTRLTGLALMPVLAYEAWIYFKKTKKYPWWLLLSLTGVVGYLLYNYITYGNPLAMVMVQSLSTYGRSISIFAPLTTIISGLSNLLAGVKTVYNNPFIYPVIVIEFFSLIFILLVVITSFKKITWPYWIYIAGSVVIILYGSSLSSITRYLLVLFPIFIFLAKSLRGAKLIVWSVLSFFVLTFMATLFLRGYFVA